MKIIVQPLSFLLLVIGIYLSTFSLLLLMSGQFDASLLSIVIVIISFISSSYLFKASERISQKVRGLVFDKKIKNPTLYLRSFKVDNTSLRSEGTVSKLISLARFHKFIAGTTLEKELTEIMSIFGTPVAIGNKQGILEPWGASRIFSDENSWKNRVLEQAKISKKIFLIIDSTPSLIWEMNTIPKNTSIEKIIFIFPPESLHREYSTKGSFAILKKEVSYFPKNISYEQIVKEKINAFYFKNNEVIFIKQGRKYYQSLLHGILQSSGSHYSAKFNMINYYINLSTFIGAFLYCAIISQYFNNRWFHVTGLTNLSDILFYIPMIIMMIGAIISLLALLFYTSIYLIKKFSS